MFFTPLIPLVQHIFPAGIGAATQAPHPVVMDDVEGQDCGAGRFIPLSVYPLVVTCGSGKAHKKLMALDGLSGKSIYNWCTFYSMFDYWRVSRSYPRLYVEQMDK